MARFCIQPLQTSCRLQLSRVWAPFQHRRTAPSIARRHVEPAATGQPGSWEASKDDNEASSNSSSSSSSSGRRTAGSSQERVAAILASAGLNPTELQQQRPDDYSRLTLQLAQVLAEVHAARVASSVRTLRLQPADLLARICFLAYKVGLTAGDLRQMVHRFSDALAFDIESGRTLLVWLQVQQVSTSELRLASLRYPTFWSMDVVRMQRGKQHLQRRTRSGQEC